MRDRRFTSISPRSVTGCRDRSRGIHAAGERAWTARPAAAGCRRGRRHGRPVGGADHGAGPGGRRRSAAPSSALACYQRRTAARRAAGERAGRRRAVGLGPGADQRDAAAVAASARRASHREAVDASEPIDRRRTGCRDAGNRDRLDRAGTACPAACVADCRRAGPGPRFAGADERRSRAGSMGWAGKWPSPVRRTRRSRDRCAMPRGSISAT